MDKSEALGSFFLNVLTTQSNQYTYSDTTETVVLLSRKNIDDHLELTWTDKDFGTSGCKATYSDIEAYILEKYGFKVSSLNIAQIKSKCGIIERENFNLPKSKNYRQAGCTPEKEEAIMDAFRHFKLI